jgi:chromosome segregation ATPase
MKRILLLTLPLLAACGPRYGMRVPGSMEKKLPYEARIELLEAENDLALAIDKVDEADNEIGRARDNIRRARSRQEAAEDEVDRATDEVSREVAKLTIAEAQMRVEYLRARQRLSVGLREVERLSLRCAFAKFELARLTVARKTKVEGSERLEPKEFEQQVSECEAEVKEERAALAEDEKTEKAAREAWEAKKAALAKKTFDARASPYVEKL